MSNELIITQFAPEAGIADDQSLRVTQFAPEAGIADDQSLRVTQFAPEAGIADDQSLRVTQFALEVGTIGAPVWVPPVWVPPVTVVCGHFVIDTYFQCAAVETIRTVVCGHFKFTADIAILLPSAVTGRVRCSQNLLVNRIVRLYLHDNGALVEETNSINGNYAFNHVSFFKYYVVAKSEELNKADLISKSFWIKDQINFNWRCEQIYPAPALDAINFEPVLWWLYPQPPGAQRIYVCKLTGDTDVVLPVSSFQLRLYNSGRSAITVVVPNAPEYATAISERITGSILIYHGYRYPDGSERVVLLACSAGLGLRYDIGGRNSSATIAASTIVDFDFDPAVEKRIESLSGYFQQADGNIRLHTVPIFGLYPGDQVLYDGTLYPVKSISVAIGSTVHSMEVLCG